VEDPITVSDGSDEERAVHRRIDIRIFPSDQYPCALLYFTGSDQLNRDMRCAVAPLHWCRAPPPDGAACRVAAQERGFVLNEYSLTPVGESGVKGEPLPVTSERGARAAAVCVGWG
jgi:DNA polymerase beta